MITLSKIPKICLNCGCEYLQRSIRQKYCGDRKLKIGCCYLVKKTKTFNYLKNNKQKMQILQKEYYLINKQKINLKRKEKRNSSRIIKPVKTKEDLIKEKNDRQKKYYYKHKERLNKEKYIYLKNKIKNDIEFRILKRVQYRIWSALKKDKNKIKTIDLLGCSIEFLRNYLESKFQKGMNWNNYGRGGWVIDHIFPISKRDLKNKKDLFKICHYTNLQPLWEKDNLIKSNKIL